MRSPRAHGLSHTACGTELSVDVLQLELWRHVGPGASLWRQHFLGGAVWFSVLLWLEAVSPGTQCFLPGPCGGDRAFCLLIQTTLCIPLGLSGSLGLFASFAQTVISGRRRPFSFISEGREAVCLTSPLSRPPCASLGGRAPQGTPVSEPWAFLSAARQMSFCPGRGRVAYVALTGSRTKGVTGQLPVGVRCWTCGRRHTLT